MSLTNLLKNTSDSTTEVRNQVSLNGEPFKTFKFNTESFTGKHQATILEQKNIGGDVLIWGNENFGTWNEFKWGTEASQSFVLGLSKLGINALGDKSSSFEIVRIVPPNDLFEEDFVGEFFIDTTSTTATLGVYGWA